MPQSHWGQVRQLLIAQVWTMLIHRMVRTKLQSMSCTICRPANGMHGSAALTKLTLIDVFPLHVEYAIHGHDGSALSLAKYLVTLLILYIGSKLPMFEAGILKAPAQPTECLFQKTQQAACGHPRLVPLFLMRRV